MRSNYHAITYGIVVMAAEHKSYLKLKTDTLYLALTGELWGVHCQDFFRKQTAL